MSQIGVVPFGAWIKWGVHPRGREKVVAMLDVFEAYCDESGIDELSRWVIVAGFVGPSAEWQRFEGEWQSATRGVTFHSRKFFSRKDGKRVGAYANWPSAIAAKYLKSVLSIIESANIKPLGAVLKKADFKALTKRQREFLTGMPLKSDDAVRWKSVGHGAPATPYHVCFGQCVALATKQTLNEPQPIEYVFDRQSEYADYALQSFQRAQAFSTTALAKKMNGCSFRSKDGVGGLQAADLMAYVLHASLEGKKVKEELGIAIARMAPVISSRSVFMLDRETITKILATLPETLQKRLAGKD